MDQANGARPPPYNSDFGKSNYSGMGDQGGNGNISTVYDPNYFANTVHPTAQTPSVMDSPPPPEYSSYPDDIGFSDSNIRRGFIKKVYFTLMLQLLVTVGIICAFLYWSALRDWTFETYWFSYVMMAVVLVLAVALSCCDNLRRQVPLNFIALGLFTVAEGLMLGSVAVYFDAEAVLWAMLATSLVSLALSLFAFQSKWDFTMLNGSLWVLMWTLFSFCLLCAVLRSQYVYIVYACLGTLVFSLYLVFDTQLIVGGKHRKYAVSPEEYVFAALNLYLDITSLFLLLLQLIGLCR
ncbi:unnamed protein product [Knipowitschia caucasica]